MSTPKPFSYGRALLVDDHDIVCEGVKSLLQKSSLFRTIDFVTTLQAVFEELESEDTDLLIMDLNLGDSCGSQVIREISETYPKLKILVLSMYPENPYAIHCIHEGAHGYLHKSQVLEKLIPAVHTVMNEEKIFLSDEYAETLSFGTEVSKKDSPLITQLSEREFEVYNLIVDGLSFKEIARRLNISPKTVSAHHAHILDKLLLSNTTQLIHFALHSQAGKS